jgi:hypothetical protein
MFHIIVKFLLKILTFEWFWYDTWCFINFYIFRFFNPDTEVTGYDQGCILGGGFSPPRRANRLWGPHSLVSHEFRE